MAQDERVVKFVAAITHEAEEQRTAIEQETQSFIEGEMAKAESDALQESFHLIQQAAANIRADAGSRISAGKSEKRRQLLLRREAIIDEVLAAVSEKIRAYTQTAEYAEFLKKSAERGSALFGKDYRVFLRPEDMRYASVVESVGCSVESDESIRLGGLKFSDMDGFKTADDTLDARLQAGRAWFMKNSGLTVR